MPGFEPRSLSSKVSYTFERRHISHRLFSVVAETNSFSQYEMRVYCVIITAMRKWLIVNFGSMSNLEKSWVSTTLQSPPTSEEDTNQSSPFLPSEGRPFHLLSFHNVIWGYFKPTLRTNRFSTLGHKWKAISNTGCCLNGSTVQPHFIWNQGKTELRASPQWFCNLSFILCYQWSFYW